MNSIYTRFRDRWKGIDESKRILFWSLIRVCLLPALAVAVLQTLSSFFQVLSQEISRLVPYAWIPGLGWNFWANYLIMLLLYLILYFLPMFKVTSVVLSLVVFLFGLAEHHVIIFKDSIIYPWDIANIKMMSGIVGNYKFQLNQYVVIAAIIFCVMVFLCVWGKKVKIDWKKRLLGILITAIVSIYFYSLFLNDVNAQYKCGFGYCPFVTISDNFNNGVLMTLAYHNTFNTMKPPDGYSEEAALDILSRVGEMPEPILSGGEKPDVIIILNESFSDLQSIADFETDTEVLPFFHSLTGDNLVKKNIYFSTKGGGTSKSETEILTGYSMNFFPFGSYPYTQFFDSEVTGLPLYLTKMGYRAIAMHPFSPEGWNRNEVFPLMGFSEFYSIQDFGEAQKTRCFVSDEAAYEFLISKYEEHKANDPETPLFEYLITMQNHGGYDLKENLPEKVEILTEQDYPEGEQFVSLIRVSDQALEGLIGYFEEVEDPVVIVFFGDHQPNFSDGFSEYMSENLLVEALDPILPFYVVPLLVWANYDISESELSQSEIPCFGANYVSALLADIIGVEDAPFLTFLLDYYEKIPMINSLAIIDAQDNVYVNNGGKLPAEIGKLVKEYEILQYYYLS